MPARIATQAPRAMPHAFEPIQGTKQAAAAGAGEALEAEHVATREIDKPRGAPMLRTSRIGAGLSRMAARAAVAGYAAPAASPSRPGR